MTLVLGGGLGGLSAAFYLKTTGHNKLYIAEALNKCGGWIQTSVGKDYIFETGPRTIRPLGESGQNTLKLLETIGLCDYVLPITSRHPSAGNRMIYANGELHTLPNSFTDLFKTKKPFTKPLIAALLQDIFAKAPNPHINDDSMYNFVSRRFGKEIADYAISPLICGICAGDAREISVKFLMKSLFEYEQQYGSVSKGSFRKAFQKKNQADQHDYTSALVGRATLEKWTSYSLKGGMQTLPNALQQAVTDDDCQVYSNLKAVKMQFYSIKGNTKANVQFSNGSTYSTDHVYSSIPAFELANLVQDNHPTLTKLLLEIPFVTVGVVNLKYSEENIIPKDGFGFLIPPLENLPILGVIYDSCCFPNENKGTVLTIMIGGKWFEERCGKNVTEEELLKIAQTNVKNILGISIVPEEYKVSILKNCIAQYTVGHYDRVKKIRDYIKDKSLPLSVIGSSFDGVGVNDVILSAKHAVEDVNK